MPKPSVFQNCKSVPRDNDSIILSAQKNENPSGRDSGPRPDLFKNFINFAQPPKVITIAQESEHEISCLGDVVFENDDSIVDDTSDNLLNVNYRASLTADKACGATLNSKVFENEKK